MRLAALVGVLGQCAFSSSSPFAFRSLAIVDRLVQCAVAPGTAVFLGEGLWQSGNTLESMSNIMMATNTSLWAPFLEKAYNTTPVIVDQCFDDHQWWLLAWIRAFQLTSNKLYIERAAQVFDYVVQHGWSDVCGGGVMWCPSQNQYKNAITNELFLACAMELHPYTSLLGKPANFYLNWASTEWKWFEQSGMLNSKGLINDGLDQNCKNNGDVTWTYNQGVLLSGLTQLGLATSNSSLVKLARTVALAVRDLLTVDGILVEPCPGNCDQDQHLFKGIFMRHLGYMLSLAPDGSLSDFLTFNAQSALRATCPGGGYSLQWDGTCQSTTVLPVVPQTSAALDVFTAAAGLAPNASFSSPSSVSSSWRGLGFGNCMDDKGQSMPNCYLAGIDEIACRDRAFADSLAVAYDFQLTCEGSSFCRVRTLSKSCGDGWQWADGTATTVSKSTGDSLTVCVIKKT